MQYRIDNADDINYFYFLARVLLMYVYVYNLENG